MYSPHHFPCQATIIRLIQNMYHNCITTGASILEYIIIHTPSPLPIIPVTFILIAFQDCGMPFLQLILSCPYLSLKINYRSSSGHTLTVISIPPIHVHSILSVPAINVTSILFLHNSLNHFNSLYSLRLLVELTNRPSDHFNHNSLIHNSFIFIIILICKMIIICY